MVTNLIKYLVLKGNAFLERRGVDAFYKPETPREKRERDLEIKIAGLRNTILTLRWEIIEQYDLFVIKTQDVYLSLLAESKNSAVQTTMTQHWMNTYELMNGLAKKHLQLVTELEMSNEELDKIRQVNN